MANQKEQKLKKGLSLIDVFSIAAGAMISSGLFILPGLAFAKTGPAVVFSYLIAGILVMPAMFTQAELSTAMPKAGGTYFFIERSMGAPVGTIGGFANWFALSFKSAFALLGIGIFVTLIKPSITELEVKVIASGAALFFMAVNILGVKEAGRFQIALVFSLIGILTIYIIHGFLAIQPQRYFPFATQGMGSVFATAGLVFISFGGLTKISSVGEEVKNPGRNIPLGMFLAFSIVMFLYIVVVFITVGVLDPAALANSHIPISLAANAFMGKFGGIALGIAAILAFVSTANAGILTASRASLAMSRDSLVPKFLKRVHPKFKTPHLSIILTTAFMVAVILFLDLENLVKTASTLQIILFILVNLSLIVMRESRIQGYRPQFRSPLYPWIQIAGIIGYIFLIFEMGAFPLLLTAAFIVFALAWYFLFARKNVKRQAALVHIIERITAKELVDTTLPGELKDIIIERDEIVEDRFDRIIHDAGILDIKDSLDMKDFFKIAAGELSQKLGMDKKDILDLLMEREKDSSTVIRPGLAIPHIIIKGDHKFKILLARCKGGIKFHGIKQKVHVVFMLIGSKDERNFHLRALAAIAEIAQAGDFDKKWLEARNADELRDIVLLAERQRFGK